MSIRKRKTVPGKILFALILVWGFPRNIQPQSQSNTKPAAPQSSQSTKATSPQPSLTDQLAKSAAFITVPYGDAKKPNTVNGTCFFVAVPDERMGKTGGFVYLVTNRHVATAAGAPANQLLPEVYIRVNASQKDGADTTSYNILPLTGKFRWYFPDDATVDLAVLPVVPKAEADIRAIPISLFATDDVLKSRAIGIGDTVFFVGYLFQFAGSSRIAPIYRNGTIAMMPSDPIPMHEQDDDEGIEEHLDLADAHAFHGNSGSPLFVNVGGYRNGTMLLGAPNIYLVGVVNGFIPETDTGKVTGAATFEGARGQLPNSGILTFVPAQELRDLLYSRPLQQVRDNDVAAAAGKH